jgi:hypothetical protein
MALRILSAADSTCDALVLNLDEIVSRSWLIPCLQRQPRFGYSSLKSQWNLEVILVDLKCLLVPFWQRHLKAQTHLPDYLIRLRVDEEMALYHLWLFQLRLCYCRCSQDAGNCSSAHV